MAEARVHPEHHFETMEQQAHAATLGMWVFLASEVLLFSGLFALYAGYRALHPEAWAAGVGENLAWLGTTNTVVLLVSSYTMARGAYSLMHGQIRMAWTLMTVTVLLGSVFLGFKSYEYLDHIHHGILPGGAGHFFLEPGHGRGLEIFFTLYYLTTGLHAVHVMVGMGLIGVFAWRVKTGRLTAAKGYQGELVAMYWHIVDLIWIFLWPLFYLTGGSQ